MMLRSTRLLTSSKLMLRAYSVMIGGGGMVGNALGLAMAKSRSLDAKKHDILIVEAGVRPDVESIDPRPGLRVSALNNSSKNFLDSLHVWPALSRKRCVLGMNTWSEGDGSSGLLTFRPEASDAGCHLHMVDNEELVRVLTKELMKCSNVDILYETRIKKFVADSNENMDDRGGQVDVHLDTKSEPIKVNLLVGADGHNSSVRRQMSNNHYFNKLYNQMGLVATLKMDDKAFEGSNNVAWQKFTRQGPIALLPLSDDVCSLVWSQPSVEAQRRLRLSDGEFVSELTSALGRPPPKAFEEKLPSVQAVEVRAAFPLGFGHALRYVQGGRIALVGDAAHRVHPLAGQGLNLGLGDAEVLIEHLEESVLSGSHRFPSHQSLFDYETQRQRYNLAMMLAIDGLHHVYKADNELVSMARRLGIKAVSEIGSIKNFITGFAR